MDFTYLVAAFLSVLIGFAGAVIFTAIRSRSYGRLLVVTVAIALIADFALLLDWSRADAMTMDLLLTDLAFFSAYAVVGCSIGALFVLSVRQLFRWVRQIGAD